MNDTSGVPRESIIRTQKFITANKWYFKQWQVHILENMSNLKSVIVLFKEVEIDIFS